MISDEQMSKRIGLNEYPLFKLGFRKAQPDMMVNAIFTEKPYPVKAIWIQTSNPLACAAAEPKRTYDALRKLDFVVVVDIFMTPTAVAAADIVLPAATYPERDGVRACDGPQFGATINKVTQIEECKSDMEITLELGKRLNPEGWPWDNVQDMFSSMFKVSYLDMSFQELREKSPVFPPYEYRKHEKGKARQDGSLGFNTPTGRIELYSTVFEQCGLDPPALF